MTSIFLRNIQRRLPARLTICRIGLVTFRLERRFSGKFDNDGEVGRTDSDRDVLK